MTHYTVCHSSTAYALNAPKKHCCEGKAELSLCVRKEETFPCLLGNTIKGMGRLGCNVASFKKQ